MKSILPVGILFISILTFSCSSSKYTPAFTQTQVDSVMNEQEYQFVAHTMLPMAGKSKTLTSLYYLKVTKTQVVSELPYAGRTYSAPMGSDETGIKFTSNDFSYTLSRGTKDTREIRISPKDSKIVNELFLTVYSNGSATLKVTPTNKQMISFQGEIQAIPKSQ